MNREVVQVLLEKPEVYLKIWAWLYSRANDDGVIQFTYNDVLIMSKVQVTTTTFYRILLTEKDWNKTKRHTKAELIEGTNTHIVRFFDKPVEIPEEEREQTETQKRKKQERKKLTEEQLELRKRCLDTYVGFYEARIGLKPMINGMQMKFLDNIIKYFQSTGKAKDDDAIVLAFQMIFQQWDTYADSIRNKYLINQISYNLPNILAHIRLLHKQSKLSKVQQASDKVSTAIESGALDDKIKTLGTRQ